MVFLAPFQALSNKALKDILFFRSHPVEHLENYTADYIKNIINKYKNMQIIKTGASSQPGERIEVGTGA